MNLLSAIGSAHTRTGLPLPANIKLRLMADGPVYTTGTTQATDNQTISTWKDISGQGKDATEATNKPTLQTNELNGKPVVRFDGTNDKLESTNTIFNTIMVVAKNSSIGTDWTGTVGLEGSTAQLFDAVYLGMDSTGDRPSFRVTNTGNTAFQATNATGKTFEAGVFHIHSADYNAGSKVLNNWIDGLKQGTATLTGTVTPSTKTGIGCNYYDSNAIDFWNGDIAEVVIWDVVLTEAQREKAIFFLSRKWGLGPWRQYTNISDNMGCSGVCVADMDNDGKEEVVVASPSDTAVPGLKIWKWIDGAWTSYSISALSGKRNRFGTDLKVADLRDSGLLDIVAIDSYNNPDSDNGGVASGELVWFENPGTLGGTWTERSISTWAGNSGTYGDTDGDSRIVHAECVVGSLLGDGKIDIVVRSTWGGVWVFKQNERDATPTWFARKYIPCFPREGLFLHNISSANGRLDIVMNGVWLETPAVPQTDSYTLCHIKGASSFYESSRNRWYPTTLNGTGVRDDYACKVFVGTFAGGTVGVILTDAERLSNSATASNGTTGKPYGIKLYLKPADPVNDNWTEKVIKGTFFNWQALTVKDINGDGMLEVISGLANLQNHASQASPTGIYQYQNDGSNNWSETAINNGVNTYLCNLVDIIGDGRYSLFAPDYYTNGNLRFFRRLRK